MALASYMAEKGLTDAQLGALVGVSGELVRLWRLGRRRISAERVGALSSATGIPRHKLRPDLWDDPAATRSTRQRRPAPSSTPSDSKPALAASES
jgi:DNA-binding transcriptional regulator YdaS (Cro superfamily)